jgi:8-oxo-dGTP pyrophosphatase MutT (NUDIX family)
MAHNVRAAIFNEEGKFLIVSEVDDPDNFKLPGGKFEGGESPDQAIVRELEEELALVEGSYELGLAKVLKTNDEGDNRYIYGAKLKPGTKLEPRDGEIAKFMWVDEGTVPEGKNKEHILSAVGAVQTLRWG